MGFSVTARGRRVAGPAMFVALAAALSLGAAPAPAKVTKLRVAGKPALIPKFRPGIPDYVAHCVPGERLRLSIKVPRNTTVAVDRGKARKRSFTANVSVARDQSFRIVVTTRRGHSRKQR